MDLAERFLRRLMENGVTHEELEQLCSEEHKPALARLASFIQAINPAPQYTYDDLYPAVIKVFYSTRTVNALTKEGVTDTGILRVHSEEELFEIRGFGEGALSQVKEYLEKHGHTLRPDKESKNERLTEVFVDPRLIPVRYLQTVIGGSIFTDSDVTRLKELGITRYGDFIEFTFDELCCLKSPYTQQQLLTHKQIKSVAEKIGELGLRMK